MIEMMSMIIKPSQRCEGFLCASGMFIIYRVQVPNERCSAYHQPRARVSTARWNLKEAGGKHLRLRTETAYKAGLYG